jgi:hypothetical protein
MSATEMSELQKQNLSLFLQNGSSVQISDVIIFLINILRVGNFEPRVIRCCYLAKYVLFFTKTYLSDPQPGVCVPLGVCEQLKGGTQNVNFVCKYQFIQRLRLN